MRCEDGLPERGGLTDSVQKHVRLAVCREYGSAVALRAQDDPLIGYEYGESVVTRPSRRVGRPKQRSLLDDLRLAEIYVEELARHRQRVNVRVAQRVGYTASWVAKRIHRMREGDDALLTATKPGLAGGELTDYAHGLRT